MKKEYIIKIKVVDTRRTQKECESLIDLIIHKGLKELELHNFGMMEVLFNETYGRR